MVAMKGAAGGVGVAVNYRRAVFSGLITFALIDPWNPSMASEAAATREIATMTMKHDLAHRSPDIHWPEGFDPRHADLFSHNELRIAAPCERVWRHIIDATQWPQWYPNSKDVHSPRSSGCPRASSLEAGLHPTEPRPPTILSMSSDIVFVFAYRCQTTYKW